MEIRNEEQLNPVADEVSAIAAVVRPILTALLYNLKADVASQVEGGRENVKLSILPRLHRSGDGDTGICFEYAVHDAIASGHAGVAERVETALRICNVSGRSDSILFGAEKQGSQQLIETASELLTDDSVLLSGSRGRPVKLKRHLTSLAAAFRRKGASSSLPQSVSGLWRADLFLGSSESDRWLGTTVKINPTRLDGAKGLRVGIVPAMQGKSDRVYLDDQRNLVVCPIPYDGSFVETFYMGWEVVTAFMNADAKLPREVALPRPTARTVARYLADRRDHTVLDVVEALEPLAQPELLRTQAEGAGIILSGGKSDVIATDAVVAPIPTIR